MFKDFQYFKLNQRPESPDTSTRQVPSLNLPEPDSVHPHPQHVSEIKSPSIHPSKSMEELSKTHPHFEENKKRSKWLSPPLPRRSFGLSKRGSEKSLLDEFALGVMDHCDKKAVIKPSSSFLKSMKISEHELKVSKSTESSEGNSLQVPNSLSFKDKSKDKECELFLIRRYFLIRLAEALFLFGSPSYRLEHLLYITSESLDVVATYATLPNLMIMSFTSKALKHSETVLLPIAPSYDFDKLFLVNQLCHEISNKTKTIDEGTNLIEHFVSSPSRWSRLTTRIAPVVTSTLMCILSFHGTWMDMLVAGTLAAILQLVNFCLSKLDSMEFLIEPVGAFIVSFAAVAFKLTFQDMICYQTIALSGVLDQLPGLTLCTSMVELTSGHIISGTARLMSGLVRALLLAFGLSIGYKTWLLFLPQSNNFFTCYPELAVANSSYWIPIFISLLPCMAVSLTLSLRPHKSQFPIMLLTSCLAFWVSLLNSTLKLSPDIGSVITSFMVGITSNIYSRFTKNPAIAPILSGVILLVPGSLGVRSSLALIDSSSFGNGSNFAFQVILTALSLSIGILASHVVSPIEAKVTLQSQPLRNEKFNWMKKVFKIDELLKLHHPNKSPRSRLSAK